MSKKRVTKIKNKVNLAELSDKIYRYDNEEKLHYFFNKKHPLENFDNSFDDVEDCRVDAVFDEYLSLIEDILEDSEMDLHIELKSLNHKELEVLKSNVYSEVYAGVF